MYNTRNANNKRRTAEDNTPVNAKSKKQITSYEGGAPTSGRKTNLEQSAIIDLDSYAIRSKLARKGDIYQRDAFPRFHHGTVYIQLVELHNKYTYALDKAILCRSSEFMANLLGEKIKEADVVLAMRVKERGGLEFFLDLQYLPEDNIWTLIKVPFTVLKSPEKEQPKTPNQAQSAITTQPKTALATVTAPGILGTPATGAGELHNSVTQPPKLRAFINITNESRTAETAAASNATSVVLAKLENQANEIGIKLEENGIKKEESVQVKADFKEEAEEAVMKTSEATEPESARPTDTTEPNEPTVNPSSEVVIGKTTTKSSSSVDANKTEMLNTSSARYAHGERPTDSSIESRDSSDRPGDPESCHLEAVDAHHNLFRLFHNLTPEIDRQDIRKSLRQTENIIVLAIRYKCLPLVRHYLSNEMLQLGRELFKAILVDPPRWLILAVRLECVPIFNEAMVHLVGNYSHYPWTKIPSSELPQFVLNIIRKKVDELRALKASIDGDLFTSSICINGESLTFLTLEKTNFDTWFIVQIWQDWFRQSLSKHCNAKHTIGALYRLMAKGGDAYMDHKTVFASLAGYKGKNFGTWNSTVIEGDLKIMKDFAQKKVKELVVNNSMLDVDEEGILHLTCTTLEHEEMPWIVKEET